MSTWQFQLLGVFRQSSGVSELRWNAREVAIGERDSFKELFPLKSAIEKKLIYYSLIRIIFLSISTLQEFFLHIINLNGH